MEALSRSLTIANIEQILRTYVASAETVGQSVAGLRGIGLLQALKRGVVGAGPYPNVALFEAANRIMTDLVILHGVRWLLRNRVFPFERYSVEYGHENNEHHDIIAELEGRVLIGEAFNVAPSFFAIKRNSAVRKLRQSSVRASYRMIMCNADAVRGSYAPKLHDREFMLLVDIRSGDASVMPHPKPELTERHPL